VSVCVPTFNAAPYIEQTLRSILSQTVSALELVVSDDASTDDTCASVERIGDARVRLIRHATNVGLEGNWNAAVRACRAPLVKLVCQDDVLYPGCLAAQVAALTDPANAGVSLAACRRDVLDDAGRAILRGRGLAGWSGRVDAAAALRGIVRFGGNPVGEPAAVMFRREAFDKAGGFSGVRPYTIDVDLWARLLFHGDLYADPRVRCAFRPSRASLSRTLVRRQAREGRAFLAELAARSPHPIRRWDRALGYLRAGISAHGRRMLYAWLESGAARRRPTETNSL
jgi:glycosyltransferase involved in cell wall biosynthesis